MSTQANGLRRRGRLIAPIMFAAWVALAGLAGAEQAADREKVDSFLEQYAATGRFRLGWPTGIRITPDGSAVLFLRSQPRSFEQDLHEFDTATGKTRVLLTAEQLLAGQKEELTAEELARRERARSAARGIASFDLSKDGRLLLVPLSGRLFIVERDNGQSKELPSNAGAAIDPQFSPDAQYVAAVRDGELYVTRTADAIERQLTQGASDTLSHGTAEFIAQEEMARFHGYWWSPDSRFLAYQETDVSDVEVLHIADPTAPDKTPAEWRYPRPGKANARVRLGIVPVEGGETVWADWDRETYPYLATVMWEKNSPLTILVQNRLQTEELLLAVDPATGVTRKLLAESDDVWLNLDQKMPHWLSDGQSFLWTTERGGAWQLERRGADGQLLATLTDPEFGYRDLLHVDEDRGIVWIQASDEPTQAHIYQVPLDSAGTASGSKARAPKRITDVPGFHSAEFGDADDVWVHIADTPDGTRRMLVRRFDGSTIGELPSVAEAPLAAPQIEIVATATEPPLRAVIVRPSTFERDKKYPVIVQVYGGPHSQMVKAAGRQYLLAQWLADRGFIVVSIDGRGTPSRGRDWERAIHGNLIDLPLADQVAGLQALGAKYPELDLTRVGIFGWSFGGYFTAMAVMQRPDVFHVGVAGGTVADWHDYDTHYTERYMGLPEQNAQGYEASSVLTYAPKLTRPLMLVHGTADDNVYFLHAAKISNSLFQAGREHEFVPLVGATHMVTDPTRVERLYSLIADYFTKHLKQ